jgi:hypothetical protein
MTILSFKDFIRQSGKRQESKIRKVQAVTVRDFLNAIETNYEDDWTAEVTWDCPETATFFVKIMPAEDA